MSWFANSVVHHCSFNISLLLILTINPLHILNSGNSCTYECICQYKRYRVLTGLNVPPQSECKQRKRSDGEKHLIPSTFINPDLGVERGGCRGGSEVLLFVSSEQNVPVL